jgi:hypothetical protein
MITSSAWKTIAGCHARSNSHTDHRERDHRTSTIFAKRGIRTPREAAVRVRAMKAARARGVPGCRPRNARPLLTRALTPHGAEAPKTQSRRPDSNRGPLHYE